MAYIPCLRIEDFNPRSPCGERPAALSGGKGQRLHFNPRSPCGERLFPHTQSPSQCPFQSTLPVRGATVGSDITDFVAVISIHAPRAGSDDIPEGYVLVEDKFQSTLPVRGATFDGMEMNLCCNIFQSTLPVRGATRKPTSRRRRRVFQSTLPVRGATKTGRAAYMGVKFQSTLPVRGATGT